jgi:hypothetical protein
MSDEKLVDGVIADGLPGAFFAPYDRRILGWVREALEEGTRIIKDDPAFPKIDQHFDYILGQQLTGPRPSYLSNVICNQTKKAVRTHAAALTDIRPVFSYKTYNTHFENNGVLLNKLAVAWYVNKRVDLNLGEGIKYSLAAGAGDFILEWDPTTEDNKLSARDPRDTLPIRPTREISIQTWEGLIIREAHTPNALKRVFPQFSEAFVPDIQGKWGEVFTKFRRVIAMVTPSSTLDGLSSQKERRTGTFPEVILYRVYINDPSINLTGHPVLMGEPGSNWAYMVQPGEALYPRKRLIVCTERAILYDGPNQYWHGKFPISRLRLDPWPWQFLGLGLVNDLMPMQDALNTVINDFLQVFSQAVNRGAIADANAVPESVFKRFDPRKPNWKLKLKPTMGEGFKLVDPPQLPPWAMDFTEALFNKFDELSETANLQALMKLRQMPGADTIEKYYESLTPGLRLEGRMLEASLAEIGEMLKANIFQFYSTKRRILLLGDAGRTFADFDFDPGNMIPAMQPSDEGYTPELDAKIPRDQRAEYFHKLFTFYVAPNSLLAMHAQEDKMEAIQLARMGYLDYWTLMEKMEYPNVGDPPPVPLPPVGYDPLDPKNAAPPTLADGSPNPVAGIPLPPPMIPRIPTTITERLQAQQHLGIGMVNSPAGRPASGNQPPQLKKKGGRQTMTESK